MENCKGTVVNHYYCCCCNGKNNTESDNAVAGLAKPIEESSIPMGKVTPLPLKNIVFDQGNFFDTDGKVQINSDGVYLVTGMINYAHNPSGTRWTYIRKNGIDLISSGMSAPNSLGLATTGTTTVTTVKLSKGDYLELCGYHLSQTSNMVSVYPSNSQLSIAKLGN